VRTEERNASKKMKTIKIFLSQPGILRGEERVPLLVYMYIYTHINEIRNKMKSMRTEERNAFFSSCTWIEIILFLLLNIIHTHTQLSKCVTYPDV